MAKRGVGGYPCPWKPETAMTSTPIILPFKNSTRLSGSTRAICLGLIAVCGFLFCSPAEARESSPRYEYVVRNAKFNNRVLEVMLNDYASNGWELLQIERGVAIFRRVVEPR